MSRKAITKKEVTGAKLARKLGVHRATVTRRLAKMGGGKKRGSWFQLSKAQISKITNGIKRK